MMKLKYQHVDQVMRGWLFKGSICQKNNGLVAHFEVGTFHPTDNMNLYYHIGYFSTQNNLL